MAVVGLDMLYYAVITEETDSAITYDTSKRIRGLIQANLDLDGQSGSLHADNGVAETMTQLGEPSAEVQVSDIPAEDYAILMGSTYSDGNLQVGFDDNPPYVALGYRRTLADGSYRYVWLYKGKFTHPAEEAQTKEASVNFGTQTTTFMATQRKSDGMLFNRIDSKDSTLPTGVTAAYLNTNFFLDPNYKAIVVI